MQTHWQVSSRCCRWGAAGWQQLVQRTFGKHCYPLGERSFFDLMFVFWLLLLWINHSGARGRLHLGGGCSSYLSGEDIPIFSGSWCLSFSSQGSGGQLDVSEPNQLSHLVEKETACSRQLIKAFDPNLQVHSMKMDMLTRTKVRFFSQTQIIILSARLNFRGLDWETAFATF